MTWLRSVGAVLAGFVAVAVLSVGTDALMHALGVFPPVPQRMSNGMFLLPAAYRAAYTVLGGYLTAAIAPKRPMAHAAVLAVLGLLGGLAGIATWMSMGGDEAGPLWYALSIPASAVPCIWAGAWMHGRMRPPPR